MAEKRVVEAEGVAEAVVGEEDAGAVLLGCAVCVNWTQLRRRGSLGAGFQRMAGLTIAIQMVRSSSLDMSDARGEEIAS